MSRPLGTNILAVKSDHDGMIPESLEGILAQWSPDDAHDPSSDIPKGTRVINLFLNTSNQLFPKFTYLFSCILVLIVIPNANNPSGATLPLDRRERIYAIAQKYNLLIIEDDPYFYLQVVLLPGSINIAVRVYHANVL